MKSAPLPADEPERLAALQRLQVLDCPPEEEFDALTQAAALACDVPISLISLVDAERQWFLARHGLPEARETPREVAFCAHAILDDQLLEVPDARCDERFADNPLVTGAPDIRYYAGVPLQLDTGQRIGTLCVIDRQPRQLNATQRRILQLLARSAARALEDRRAALVERQLKEEAELARVRLAASEARFRALSEASPLGVFLTDAAGSCTYTNDRWQALYGLSLEDSLGDRWAAALHPDDRPAVFAEWQRAAAAGEDFSMEFRVGRADGALCHVHARARPLCGPDGCITGFAGTTEDVTARHAMEEALRQSEQLLKRTGEVAGVGGWIVDIGSGSVGWSAEASRIFGLPRDATPDLDTVVHLFAPAAQPVMHAVIDSACSGGRSWDLELPLAATGRRQRWVRAVGDIDTGASGRRRLVGAFEDITQRVEQRRLLSQANERIALATDSGGIGIWDMDLQTGDMVWDACMFRLYGLTDSPWPVRRDEWLQSVHGEDRAPLERLLQALAQGATTTLDTEFRILTAQHAVRHVRAAARALRESESSHLRIVGVSWDVTPLRELGSELAEQHELMRVTLQSIGDAVITTDAVGKVAWINPVAESLTGWRNNEATGQPLGQIFALGAAADGTAGDPFARCRDAGTAISLAADTVLVARDGAQRGIEASIAPIRSAEGRFLGSVLVFHDETEQRRLAGEMHYRASHDALTGLVNRAEFDQRLQRLVQQVQDSDEQHVLLYIDLDHFKQVNDRCGHAAGDRLLQQIARLLGECVRSRDTLARLGGDEFAVVLERCPPAQAERVATTICRRMDDFVFQHDGQSFRLGTSIGLVPVDRRWPGLAPLLEAADTSCYAAKQGGRNRVHVWQDSDRSEPPAGQMNWGERIEQALTHDGFVLHAQTMHALVTHPGGLQLEVLLRMRSDDGSLLLPRAFMPPAERFHLAARVDLWVIGRTLATLARVQQPERIALVCVNLSGQSTADRAFQREALALLEAAGPVLCGRLCFEMSEAAVVSHAADCRQFIESLHGLGVRVALDDFGTGSSTFGYLRGMDVDLLKIDGSFVRDMLDDPLDAVAVRCFVEVAAVMGVGTVAKLVERPELLDHLRAAGVDHVQGTQLHTPQPLDEVLAVV